MSMSKFEILKLFRQKLIEFLDALVEKLPKERDIVVLRVLFSDQIPIEKAIEVFSSRILPYEDMVINKDERFFLECSDLFEGVKGDKVHYFKNLWTSPTFTEEDKEVLWQWFKCFLKLALKYKAINQ